MTWHLDGALLDRYQHGVLPPPQAASVEAHVLSCPACRASLGSAISASAGDRLDAVWASLVEEVDAPRPGVVERLLLRVGVRDHVARLLAATPSLRGSWLSAVVLVLVVAVGLSRGGAGESGRLIFLLLAPLLPVLGVAASFGPRVDPAHEVAVAAPMHGLSLLLLRSTAVVAVTTALAGAAAVALPHADWQAASWLLPSLCLATCTVAASTWWPPPRVAVAVAVAWAVVSLVAVGDARSRAAAGGHVVDRVVAFQPTGQLVFLAGTLVAVLVVVRRRDTLELGRLA